MSPSSLIVTCRNLAGVPSHHYSPVFAQTVLAAFEKFSPDAVAVELPTTLASEMDWCVSCWPEPVALISEKYTLPFVPGDSMVEAIRLAYQNKIPTFCVDLDVADPIRRLSTYVLPSSEFAMRVGKQFLETTDALRDAQGCPPDEDLAREAFMAQRLAELMKQFRCVLWVGGMAHWTRIAERLRLGNFSGPQVGAVERRTVRRAKLMGTALLRMTGRFPFLINRYAKDPSGYNEWETIQALGLAALRSKSRVTIKIAGQRESLEDELPEPMRASVDLARMLIYARNLAASSGLREIPQLGELLTAASSTLSNRYAGRLYLTAMREIRRPRSGRLPALSYGYEGGVQGYQLDGEWISTEPYWIPGAGSRSIWVPQKGGATKRIKEPFACLSPAKEGDRLGWMAYPTDETAYEAFVHYAMEHASLPDLQEYKSFPFQTGLRDGLDVRNTLRHWQDETIYVREQRNTPLRITNAIVDFSSKSEESSILRGEAKGGLRGGWVDPSCDNLGTCSRDVSHIVLQERPCHVSLQQREFSLISLDCTNSVKSSKRKSFYDLVIYPLVVLPKKDDNLYGWLEIMFRFCKRKAVAYYAAYTPSARVKQIARKHGVNLIHIPLSRIPQPLLERNQTFRFLHLSKSQWEELLKAIADQKNAWVPESGQRE